MRGKKIKKKGSSKTSQDYWAMLQPILKIGGGAVLFYVFGFTIVQTYIYRNRLEGMFWLTKEFYIDAGGKFLLEMVRAPLLAFYIFIPYLILLYLLIPKKENLKDLISSLNELKARMLKSRKSKSRKPKYHFGQWVRLFSLIALAIGTYLFALYYEKVLDNNIFRELIYILFINPTNKQYPNLRQSLAFFSLVTPMIVALAILMHRLHGLPKSGIAYYMVMILCLAFFAIIPIAYGFYIYDWQLVRIKEPKIIEKLVPKEKQKTTSACYWLLGRFGDEYLFFKKEGNEMEGVIESFDKEDIKYLNFNVKESDSLREQMALVKITDKKLEKNAEKSIQTLY